MRIQQKILLFCSLWKRKSDLHLQSQLLGEGENSSCRSRGVDGTQYIIRMQNRGFEAGVEEGAARVSLLPRLPTFTHSQRWGLARTTTFQRGISFSFSPLPTCALSHANSIIVSLRGTSRIMTCAPLLRFFAYRCRPLRLARHLLRQRFCFFV